MTLKSSGPLTTKEINQYLSRNSLDTFSMESNVSRGLAKRPNSRQQIAYSDYLGKSILPTYQLTVNKSSVMANESSFESFTVTLTTTNVPDNTPVPYNITGIASADIGGAALTGQFIVRNNSAAATFIATKVIAAPPPPPAPTPEPPPPPQPTPFARIVADTSRVNPGDLVTFTVTSSNVAKNQLAWKNIGTSADSNVFSGTISGLVNLNSSGSGSFSLRVNPQYNIANSGKNIIMSLSDDGTVLATTNSVIITVLAPPQPRVLSAFWTPPTVSDLEQPAVLSWASENADYVNITLGIFGSIKTDTSKTFNQQLPSGAISERFIRPGNYSAMITAVKGSAVDTVTVDILVRDLTPKFDPPGEVYYTASGTYSFTIPRYANQIEIACIGGGGGGGGLDRITNVGKFGQSSSAGSVQASGGGGGGHGKYYGTPGYGSVAAGGQGLSGKNLYPGAAGLHTAPRGGSIDAPGGVFDVNSGRVPGSVLGLVFPVNAGRGGRSGPTVKNSHWAYSGTGGGGGAALSSFNVGELTPGNTLTIVVGSGGEAVANPAAGPGFAGAVGIKWR